MAKIQRSADDLQQQLDIQLEKLRFLNSHFDAGEEHLSTEIAVKLRILLSDTRQNTSLLKKLEIKDNLQLIDTAGEFDPLNLATSYNLINIRLDIKSDGKGNVQNTAQYEPKIERFGGNTRLLPFDKWWSMTVICDSERRELSRKDLVLDLADQDGGAHVDSSLTDHYHDLSRQNSLAWQLVVDGKNQTAPMGNPAPACIRQISYELLRSFDIYNETIKKAS